MGDFPYRTLCVLAAVLVSVALARAQPERAQEPFSGAGGVICVVERSPVSATDMRTSCSLSIERPCDARFLCIARRQVSWYVIHTALIPSGAHRSAAIAPIPARFQPAKVAS